MSFEPKKRDVIEVDEFNIQYHLNTSLEAEGISVSEDLINRTLDAIRRQRAEDNGLASEELKNKKPSSILKHTRFLVKIAAAILVLVVGINVVRVIIPFGMKSDKSFESNDSAPKSFLGSSKEDSNRKYESKAERADKDTNIMMSEGDMDYSGNGFTTDEYDKAEQQAGLAIDDVKLGTTSNNGDTLVFADIAMMDSSDVSMITITSKETGQIKTIDLQEEIFGIYSVMENQFFYYGTGDVNGDVNADANADVQFVVKLIGEDMDSQIVIGIDSIEVENTNKDTFSYSSYHSADHNKLLEDLEELLTK